VRLITFAQLGPEKGISHCRDHVRRLVKVGKFPAPIQLIEWPTIGVPEDYLALIAPARRAFITEGRQTVAHGGVCLEEVIVPFVSITRPS
jgi:hypothetical protein